MVTDLRVDDRARKDVARFATSAVIGKETRVMTLLNDDESDGGLVVGIQRRASLVGKERTVGQNQAVLRIRIIHFPTSDGVSKVSEGVSAAEHASKVSSVEQVNE